MKKSERTHDIDNWGVKCTKKCSPKKSYTSWEGVLSSQ